MSSSPSFCVLGKNEINFLAEQFFPEISVGIIMTEWEEFKFELIYIKKKYQLLKENLTNNNLKLKQTASEWTLQYIVKGFRGDNYIYICELAKIALITPATNASPERGASAVKGVKSQMRSTMKNDLLNSLLHISINGPPANSKEADQLLERVCNAYANEKHKKIPQVYSLGKTEASSSTQTENNVESTVENFEETSCLKFVQPDFYQASFMISNSTKEEFSEEDGNVSNVEVV